ncbi:MAG TPA: enoyl-CoA hydratase/isomerase family protein [Candidatus Binataceae bacterium]|nr:enoyl-CoA hydratase/isomerase family protein [Candidatus Binataceae bacterium]
MAEVNWEMRESIAVVSFDNQRRLNAIDETLARGLAETIATIAERPEVGALIIRGAGTRAFCAGNDLKFIAEYGDRAAAFAALEQHIEPLRRTMAKLPFPSVAMLHGICYGGGVNLALMADFRFADRALKVAIPALKMRRYYPVAGLERLSALVGLNNAKRLVLEGEPIDAERLLAWGFIDQLLEVAELEPATLAFAQRLASQPREAVPTYLQIFRALERGDGEAACRIRQQALAGSTPQKAS